MLYARSLAHLLTAQHRQLCRAAAAAATAPVQQGHSWHSQKRSAHADAQQEPVESLNRDNSAPFEPLDQADAEVFSRQQREWLPRRALPPAGAYGVKITIKAHDLLLVKLASHAVRDLVMVNFAPKSQNVLPESLRPSKSMPWVNLVSYLQCRGVEADISKTRAEISATFKKSDGELHVWNCSACSILHPHHCTCDLMHYHCSLPSSFQNPLKSCAMSVTSTHLV